MGYLFLWRSNMGSHRNGLCLQKYCLISCRSPLYTPSHYHHQAQGCHSQAKDSDYGASQSTPPSLFFPNTRLDLACRPPLQSQLFSKCQLHLDVQELENQTALALWKAWGYPNQLWLSHNSACAFLPMEWCPGASLLLQHCPVTKGSLNTVNSHVLPPPSHHAIWQIGHETHNARECE